ncbi:Origin recognition complex, subunit 1, and related proteins [Phaffia rhodozyma]|uniref:Origin recognition complex subunit 1 n=1 Tax=Phaffia rhodozyma TaxID=264483 RepID=A0A0F7SUS1_PHARH|nr:Origin recognition complex, subunit 1, and related proteins [Phaffia rhodozyma]
MATPRRREQRSLLPLFSPAPSSPKRISTRKTAEDRPEYTWLDPLPSSTFPDNRTILYSGFTRSVTPLGNKVTTKKKQPAKPNVDVDYRVGDTVFIETINPKISSVGVIVQIGEFLPRSDSRGPMDIEKESLVDRELEAYSSGWVDIKWFLRFKELPWTVQTSLKKSPAYDSEANATELYWASAVNPDDEVRRCSREIILDKVVVSDQINHENTKEIEKLVVSFSKRESRSWWCRSIADSKTGNVWSFEDVGHPGWEVFRKEAIEGMGELERWVAKRPGPIKKALPPATPTKPRVAPTTNSVSSATLKSTAVIVANTTDSTPQKASASITTPPLSRTNKKPRLDEPASEPSVLSEDEEASDVIVVEEEEEKDAEEVSATEGESNEVAGQKRKRGAAAGKKISDKANEKAASSKTTAEATKKATERKKKMAIVVARRRAGVKSRPLMDLPNELMLPADPYKRALHLLHVGATPESLPCREEQYAEVQVKIEGVIDGGGGGCIYISGQPGTGKTATVHAVIRELRQKSLDGELLPFEYVEINGLKIPDPEHAYVVLWNALRGAATGAAVKERARDSDDDNEDEGSIPQRQVSGKAALKGLEGYFGGNKRTMIGPGRCTYVVLMDELDQMFTNKQDVVYNFFNWPTMPGSQLVVIAVANTMDMPEKLAGRVKSRMGMERINFPPYTRDQLVEIVQSRMIPHPDLEIRKKAKELDHQVIEKEALILAAAKTTGVTGDARRMLDVCRRAVELAIPVQPSKQLPKPVRIKQISAVLAEMSKNPTAQFVRNCSLFEKVMLAAVVRCTRRLGVGEIEWGRLKYNHSLILSSLTSLPPSKTRLTSSEYLSILTSLSSSYALDVASSTIGQGSGLGSVNVVDDFRRIALGVGLDDSEVGRVLRDLKGEIGGEMWRGMFE